MQCRPRHSTLVSSSLFELEWEKKGKNKLSKLKTRNVLIAQKTIFYNREQVNNRRIGRIGIDFTFTDLLTFMFHVSFSCACH